MKTRSIHLIVIVALVLGFVTITPPQTARAATVYWDGGGDGSSWTDASNWVGDALPTTGDDVVFDNSVVSGNYTVNLPGDPISPTVLSLTITPGSGNTITTTLPTSNTAQYGFTATNGVTLNEGGVFLNSSRSTDDPCIGLWIPSGLITINSGGRYIHNTRCSSSGIVGKISGDESGIFEYDVPGNTSYGIHSTTQFRSLTLSHSDTGTINYFPLATITIRGNLSINESVAFYPWDRDITFGGTSNQLISGAGTLNSFEANLNISAGATVTLQKDITVDGTLNINDTLNTGTSTVSGSGTVNLLASGTLGIGSPDGIAAASASGNIQTTTRNFDGGATYHYNGTDAQNTGDGLPSGVDHLIIDNSAGVTLSNAATINTTLTLSNGLFTNGSNLTLAAGAAIDRAAGSLNAAPTFGTSVNLIYSGDTAVTASYEIPTTSGVLNDLTVSKTDGMTVTLTSSPDVNNDLTIDSGAVLNLSTYNITVDNTLTNNGTLVQERTVNNANVEFLHIQDSTGSTTQYRGVEIDTSADNNNLGTVTVRLRDNAGMTCTTSGGSSPAYAPRCIDIAPTNNLSATVTLWSPTSALPGAVTTPRVFHWSGTGWDQLTNGSSGTSGSYTYARGNTSGFSPFLMAEDGSAPNAISLRQFDATSPLPLGLLAILSITILLIVGISYIRQSQRNL